MVQKLIGANMTILERIRHLNEAVGTKLTSLNQSGLYASGDRNDSSVIPSIGRPGGIDRTTELISK